MRLPGIADASPQLGSPYIRKQILIQQTPPRRQRKKLEPAGADSSFISSN
jgi:hypothetical protein